jgi:hypothetical protein
LAENGSHAWNLPQFFFDRGVSVALFNADGITPVPGMVRSFLMEPA